ncbi:class I SAM-dependent methyltransferase [Ktedonobacteria bacterium brp13]|nr:class I SAM-dependent methyltransferase [Ktedonobacteria bacterium brp13]
MDNKSEIVSKSNDQSVKSCCADVYQSDWARLLLGDSFHPGGTALTEYLGTLLQLGPGQRVLDVAAGQGTSAIHLAQRFGCTVLGIEYSSLAVERANQAAQTANVAHLVTFEQGDAERLPVPAASFDVVLCECAFCTFPNKAVAASEFRRVLKAGGRVGLSDLTRMGEVPEELQGLLAWIACIADAQPIENYERYLSATGLSIQRVEQHNEALSELVREIQGKLLGTELLVKLKKLHLPDEIDFAQAKTMVKAASTAIQAQRFGYAIVTAELQAETVSMR